MNFQKILISFLLAVSCSFFIAGCVVVKHDPNYQPGSRTYTHNSAVYWYYYPQSRVYYHITERYYYYPVGAAWRKTTRLPAGWVLDPKHRVRLKISGKPHLKHAAHQRRYPVRNAAGSRPVPPPQANENARQHNVKDDHPRHQQHPVNHANRPEHAARGKPNKNHVPPGLEKSEKGKSAKHKPGKANPVFNRAKPKGTPGQSRKAREFAKQGQGPAKGNNRNNMGHNRPEKNKHDRQQAKGNRPAQKPPHDKVKAGAQQKSTVKQKHSRDSHKPSAMARGSEKSQPSRKTNSSMPAQHKQTAKTNSKSSASKANGRSDKFKSGERKQANTAPETDSRSKIDVNKQASGGKQRPQKGPGKKQAKASNEKGKTKPGKSSAKKNNNQHTSDTEDKSGHRAEDTKGNQGNSKRQ